MATRCDEYGIGVAAFAAALFLSGCATNASVKQELEAPEAPYRYGVSWGHAGRGGAAERASDYIHVLHRGKIYFVRNAVVPQRANRTTPSLESTAVAITSARERTDIAKWIENIVSAIDAAPRRNSDNTKLRNAWERYCRGGEGLTENEWGLITKAGAPANVPADLAHTCVHPK